MSPMYPADVMTGPKRNLEFAAWFDRVAGGQSNRTISRLTGVSHTYVGDIRWGVVPSYPILRQLCEGLALADPDAEEGFHLAGYGSAPVPLAVPQAVPEPHRPTNGHVVLPPAGDTADESPTDYFWRRVRELAAVYQPRHLPLPTFEGGSNNLTREQAEKALQIIEELLQAEAGLKLA